MATNITSTALEAAITAAIVSELNPNCKLAFYTIANVELATLTGGTATADAGTSPDQVGITGLVDDTAESGDVNYAVLTDASDAEILRFTDPVNDIGLSNGTFTLGDTISLTSLAVAVPV